MPRLTAAVILALTGVAQAQKTPDQTMQALRTADGFEVGLFASEPMITNPTALDVDTQGRVWVAEGQYYRRAAKDPGIDKIKVLEDLDGDGKADKATVFADDLLVPMSVCVAGDKVYVGESPNLYVYEDKDGDLVADPGSKRVLLKGFGGRNHDHGLHSLTLGPDHKLYMTNGDTGFNVTGPDGRNIQFQWGAMIRCNLDGTGLEAIAVNFRNPYELAVDSFGNVWCSDNDNDGLKSVRICWILEGGNYGWFGHPLRIRNPDGSFDPRNHWRIDTLGFVPYVMITGFGSPCGMAVYESNTFGPRYQSQFLHADAGPRELRCYHVTKYGAGFRATRENVLTTEDDDYFRPSDVCVAPDASLYVADWYDGGVGGHAYNNPSQGRIYKLTAKQKKHQRGAPAGPYESVAEAIIGLGSPNLATQYLARERLIAAGDKSLDALEALANGSDAIMRARALWLLDRIGDAGRRIVRDTLSDRDPAFRALAMRILRRHDDTLDAVLAKIDDTSPEVRREVMLALRGKSDDRITDALVRLTNQWDGADRFYLETINIAANGYREALFRQVVENDATRFDQRRIDLARILRPDDAADYLAARLGSGKLSDADAATVVETLAGMHEPQAGKALLDVLGRSIPDEQKRVAIAALGRNLSGLWAALRTEQGLVTGIGAALERPTLRREAMRIAGDYGLNSLAGRITKLAESLGLAEADRVTAVDALAKLTGDTSASTFQTLLRDESHAVRDAAVKALIAQRNFSILQEVLVGDAYPKRLKHDAVRDLTVISDGCFFLLPLIEKKRITPDLVGRAIRAATNHPDTNVRLLYQKFIPEADRPKTLGTSIDPKRILTATGDPARGQDIFHHGAGKCATCHMVLGRGKDIGPDLSQIGLKYERAALLDTILYPSKAVAHEYVPHIIQTDAHGVIAAFIVQETPRQLMVKTENGARLTINRADIIDMARQETSLMPELLLGGVTVQDAADLLAYLAGLKQAMATVTHWRGVGPFPNRDDKGLTTPFGPERDAAAPDLNAAYSGLNNRDVRWTTTQTREINGYQILDMVRFCRQQKARTDNVVCYFLTYIDSPQAQDASLLVGSDDGRRVWLNGRLVNEKHAHSAVRFGEQTVNVKLENGRNTLLVKVEQGNGDAGLAMAILSQATVTLATE